jgi:hypothetical protein
VSAMEHRRHGKWRVVETFPTELSFMPLLCGLLLHLAETILMRHRFHYDINCGLQNKSFQQMQPNICLYCICYFSPYMFRALTGPSSGVSWAACLCHHFVHAVLLSVRASADGGLVVLSTEYKTTVRGRTDRQQHYMSQMVA